MQTVTVLSSRTMHYDFTNTETGEIIWQGKTAHDIVDRTMKYNDCLITRKPKLVMINFTTKQFTARILAKQ